MICCEISWTMNNTKLWEIGCGRVWRQRMKLKLGKFCELIENSKKMHFFDAFKQKKYFTDKMPILFAFNKWCFTLSGRLHEFEAHGHFNFVLVQEYLVPWWPGLLAWFRNLCFYAFTVAMILKLWYVQHIHKLPNTNAPQIKFNSENQIF